MLLALVSACGSVSSRMPGRTSPKVAAHAATAFVQTGRTPADLPPGARIRYNDVDHWYGRHVARVSRANSDTIWLESGKAVLVAEIRRLEISLTGDTKTRRLMWGTLIGAGIGAIYGATIEPTECDELCAGDGGASLDGPGFWATVFSVYGAFGGLVATAVIVPNEKWERIALPAPER